MISHGIEVKKRWNSMASRKVHPGDLIAPLIVHSGQEYARFLVEWVETCFNVVLANWSVTIQPIVVERAFIVAATCVFTGWAFCMPVRPTGHYTWIKRAEMAGAYTMWAAIEKEKNLIFFMTRDCSK
jgi:hypothetical protein